MHYYKRNIGDYHKKAGRLTILQHGTYMLLIDSCYDREQFPTLIDAIDWVWASTDEEIQALKFVLNKFFELNEDGLYVQKRINEEVQEYRKTCQENSKNGKKRGSTKGTKNKAKKSEVVNLKSEPLNLKSEPKANESEVAQNKSLTTNQEPLTINKNINIQKINTRKKFIKPTMDELTEYISTRDIKIDPEKFMDFYGANGWVQGKGKPIKDWKACVRTWEKNNLNSVNPNEKNSRRDGRTQQQIINADFAANPIKFADF